MISSAAANARVALTVGHDRATVVTVVTASVLPQSSGDLGLRIPAQATRPVFVRNRAEVADHIVGEEHVVAACVESVLDVGKKLGSDAFLNRLGGLQ